MSLLSCIPICSEIRFAHVLPSFHHFVVVQPFHHVQLWTHHHNIATIFILLAAQHPRWQIIRTCTKVYWEKWKIHRLGRCIRGIRHTIGHSTRQHIKRNRSIRAGGICTALRAVGWIWAIPGCMPQWLIMRLVPIIHRFRIRCRTRRTCWALASTYCRTHIKCYPLNLSEVSHCRIPRIRRLQHHKRHHHDLNAGIPDVPHAIARIVRKPNALVRPACIYANGIFTVAIYRAAAKFTAKLAIWRHT